MTITLDPGSIGKHAVYAHHPFQPGKAPEAMPIYIGMCEYTELLSPPDARRNKRWREAFAVPGWLIDVRVIGLYDDEATAKAVQAIHIASAKGMLFNDPATDHISKGKRVLCVETGEIFDSQAAACAAHHCTRSAMSYHLNRAPGYKTIRGKTYERTE